MNQHVRLSPFPPTTRAAEGFARRAWTVAEVEAAVEAGVLSAEERFELIGGEIVPMSPDGNRHILVKGEIHEFFFVRRPKGVTAFAESTLRLSDNTFVTPELYLFPSAFKRDLTRLNGAEVLLCVEVSDSTLRYDLGLKVETYAAHGVREVWVINANTLVTRVHRRPGARGYTETADVPHTRGITPVLMPKLTLRIADLGLKPLKSKA